MSNWGTAIERLAEETVRSADEEDDKYARCIEWSIRHLRYENLWFNQASYEFNMTADVAAYGQETASGEADGYPADFLKVRNATLQLSGSSTYHPLGAPTTIEVYRDLHAHDDDSGYPQNYAFYANEFLFFPTPNEAHSVTIDYTQDIGTPVNSYSNGVWSVAVGGVAVGDTYTNAWFTDGQEVMLARARFYWFSRFDRNGDMMLVARVDAKAELDKLRFQSRKFVKPRPTRPWV